MSVINQMLKDLEQRTPEQGQISVPVTSNNKPSTIKIVLISLVVLVSLNFIGLYIWNLQEQVTSSELKLKEQEEQEEQEKALVAYASKVLPQQSVKKLKTEPQVSSKEVILSETAEELEIVLPQEPVVKKQTNLPKVPSTNVVEPKLAIQAKTIEPTLEPVSSPVVVKKITESKMSVSRRQLTSEELVAQKLVRAEKSIKLNDVTKAEQLFEEVLIIDPNNKQARKKLAALWFGRKSYIQATNLLSQGISLDPSDADLRLLKARIHLQQGQHTAAYNTLKALPTVKQKEYQVMLANVSQKIEQYKSAITAYEILIDMQAYSGRWHLGLAIIYDKTSQFSLAVAEYKLALSKSDLSVASANFAQQRIQALGE